MAVVQYLIIGLVTTQDKALTALGLLDAQANQRRQELIAEFDLVEPPKVEPAKPFRNQHLLIR